MFFTQIGMGSVPVSGRYRGAPFDRVHFACCFDIRQRHAGDGLPWPADLSNEWQMLFNSIGFSIVLKDAYIPVRFQGPSRFGECAWIYAGAKGSAVMPVEERLVAVDGHVHVYPCHDAGRALRGLCGALSGAAARAAPGQGAPVVVALLAERADCCFFRQIGMGRAKADGVAVRALPDPDAFMLETNGDAALYLVAGRQVVTAERVEVLSLTRDFMIPDGLPLAEAVQRVRDAGAVPALSWAPGKWLLGRGGMVRRAILEARPGEMLLCDSSLRPRGWPEPAAMRLARKRGLGIAAGSDPLPFPGEESIAGVYGFMLRCRFDPGAPAVSIRAAMLEPGAALTRIGKRCSIHKVIQRLGRNMAVKR